MPSSLKPESIHYLRRRTIIFIIVVVSLITAITATNFILVSYKEDLLVTVNVSGRQRMLSQRTTLFATILVKQLRINREDFDVQNYYLDKYHSALHLFEDSHIDLIKGEKDKKIAYPSRILKEHYFGAETQLDALAKEFIAAGSIIYDVFDKQEFTDENINLVRTNLRRMQELSSSILLQRLDEAVKLYEVEGSFFIKKLQIVNLILFFFSIAFLIYFWRAVYRPMEGRMTLILGALTREKDAHAQEKTRLNLALQGTSTGVWDYNVERNSFFASPVLIDLLGLHYCNMYKYKLSEFLRLVHPNYKRTFVKNMIQHVRKPKRFEEEVRIKHAKGHYIWAKVRGQVISDKKSQATRIVGSVEDFTEIKTINQTTENLMQGIEASDIAFAIINYDHQKNLFTYASQAFCDLMGCSFEEVLQRNFNMFTGPETDMGSLDMIDYAFKNGNDLTLKIYSYRIDGTGFWNEIILRPIRDKNTNEIYTYIVVFNDLTTSILQEKKEISRQRVESLGALAGSVAHEINNLLMPMTMAKDMLEDSLKEDCDPFAIEQLDIMVDYANQAKEIVEGILTFSRKDTKNIEAAFLYNEIEKSITFIKGLISSKVIIIWETGDNQELKNIQTLINTTELKQIVTNLCRNAEDAMNGKSGIITLSMSHQTLSVEERDNLEVIASDFAVLKVEDDGSGIPNEKLEKIFEPLYTTKDVGQGTGLGLSIVMGILRSWGGAITVKSKLGKGTTFKLYIPIHKMSDNYDDLADFAESVDFINPDFTRD